MKKAIVEVKKPITNMKRTIAKAKRFVTKMKRTIAKVKRSINKKGLKSPLNRLLPVPARHIAAAPAPYACRKTISKTCSICPTGITSMSINSSNSSW